MANRGVEPRTSGVSNHHSPPELIDQDTNAADRGVEPRTFGLTDQRYNQLSQSTFHCVRNVLSCQYLFRLSTRVSSQGRLAQWKTEHLSHKPKVRGSNPRPAYFWMN